MDSDMYFYIFVLSDDYPIGANSGSPATMGVNKQSGGEPLVDSPTAVDRNHLFANN
jgi:hypothetical protein